ncbi:class I SAM-dependent methyltransferase [Paenibacillus radicis (ex Gao et al. 2016)]|uniref:SAM-dependent methyltransferase n=1 Tax=Paenibacillus radicis (ex Gao et al. 2016) TaxID=1737354 RepID=A0A917HEN5_9BACL|nr:methyltransferase domain-containing protein [Paenibacillus radicis (ex Gao et al. 2016)]GGG76689.1 SAM-dependent methyltransferase [Paenibacillus radicis (ex Gao et al. 2016)]
MKTMQERFLFLQKFSRQPRMIGSITPSSRFLANTILGSIHWEHIEAVAELGAGTGAITKRLSQYAGEKTKVLLFEQEPELFHKLKTNYPSYDCHPDARYLTQTLQQSGIDGLDCVISGLPFYNFPQLMRDQLMKQIHSALKPGGMFVAFQYSLQMRKQFSSSFEVERVAFMPLNIPPAFIYICRKR